MNTPPPRRPGTDEVALTELRNAGATYDFLRKKGDPVQFWETLRLARNRRAMIAPPQGPVTPPAPEIEAAIVHELDLIRRQTAPLVRDLRGFLKKLPGLPEPVDRLEMSLSFLLASPHEHKAVARWLAEPGKHEGKAAEKLRTLAAITDPYREALRPWVLQVPPESIQSKFSDQDGAAPLECLRRALECREILAGMHLDVELWETLLLVVQEPEPARAALQKLVHQLEEGLLEEAQTGAEALHATVTELRSKFAGWVRSLREFLSKGSLLPEDSRAFDVALGFMLGAPGVRDRVPHWLKDPATWQKEVPDLLLPWMKRSEEYLPILKAAGA